MDIQEFKTKMQCKKNVLVESLKVDKLDNILPAVEEGTVYCVVTQKNINPYSFVLSAVKRYGAIDELNIATYRVSAKAANNFRYMLEEGLIQQFNLVVNDNYETLMKDKSSILRELHEARENFTLIQRNSHAKVTLISNDYLVITGSGNYSNNPKIEQYTIMKDKDLYEFHREWMLNG